MSIWIDIGALDDLPLRGSRCVQTPTGKIGVFRTADDRVFAIRNECPHKGGPLTEGIVHGHSVTCPLHNWVISLETGLAQGADDVLLPDDVGEAPRAVTAIQRGGGGHEPLSLGTRSAAPGRRNFAVCGSCRARGSGPS